MDAVVNFVLNNRSKVIVGAVTVGIASILMYLLRRHAAGGRYTGKTSHMKGKVVVITGANTGIGFTAARTLYSYGCTLILICRTKDIAESTKKRLNGNNANDDRIKCYGCDLSLLANVKKVAAQLVTDGMKIDYLVNNAGLWGPTYSRTSEGLDAVFTVNLLSPFALTRLLEPLYTASTRVINVSSALYARGIIHPDGSLYNETVDENSYAQMSAYGSSKLGLILMSQWQQKLWEQQQNQGLRVCCSLHPGVVRTDLARDVGAVKRFLFLSVLRLVGKSPEEGAQTTIHCVCSPELKPGYYGDCQLQAPSKHKDASNLELAQKLWDRLNTIVGSRLGDSWLQLQ